MSYCKRKDRQTRWGRKKGGEKGISEPTYQDRRPLHRERQKENFSMEPRLISWQERILQREMDRKEKGRRTIVLVPSGPEASSKVVKFLEKAAHLLMLPVSSKKSFVRNRENGRGREEGKEGRQGRKARKEGEEGRRGRSATIQSLSSS
jgi:hypothetical protein